MKILITGVRGMLGRDLYNYVKEQGYDVLGIGKQDEVAGVDNYRKCNLLDFYTVNQLICEYQPDVVIHCAAFTDVNAAEKSFSQPTQNNVFATKWLAQACKDQNVHLIYISTDYVFGEADMDVLRYPGDEKGTALNRYGATKSQGEDIVMETLSDWCIVRTSGLFGLHGNNFVKSIVRQAQKGRDLWVVNDNRCRPTYTKDLVAELLLLAANKSKGIFHITNTGEYASWYDIAEEILKIGNYNVALNGRSSDEDLTKRIKNSQLLCNNPNELPHWRDAIARYMRQMEYIEDGSTI